MRLKTRELKNLGTWSNTFVYMYVVCPGEVRNKTKCDYIICHYVDYTLLLYHMDSNEKLLTCLLIFKMKKHFC